MKVITSPELRSRLTNAAANGSRIAGDILKELRSNRSASETIRGNANYFTTKRFNGNSDGINTIRVYFTACNKDITNEHFPDRDNPQAPWFTENRTEIEPSTFVGYFRNLPEYSDPEMEFFASAICLDSKVTIKVYTRMNDFYDAYNEEKYIPVAQKNCYSLHNSCMRYENMARNAADFYANFAKARIMVAKDSANNVLARAVLWDNALWKGDSYDVTVSVLDRLYFSYSFLTKLMYDHAAGLGVILRKTHNDYQHQMAFTALNPLPERNMAKDEKIDDVLMNIPLPATTWHKYGAPYLDTFSHIHINQDAQFELWNYKGPRCFATCRSTNGNAQKEKNICPRCGKVHESNLRELCKECRDQMYVSTAFGDVMICKTINYKDMDYPAVLFKRGRPLPFMKTYLQVQKLY